MKIMAEKKSIIKYRRKKKKDKEERKLRISLRPAMGLI